MQNSGLGFPPVTEVVKNLVIINVLFFLGTFAVGSSLNIDLINILGLHSWLSPEFAPFQVVTHLFMHSTDGIFHILFNMLMLWMFGSSLEMVWGPKRFLFFYFFTGLGAALLYSVVNYWEVYPALSSINAFLDGPTANNLASLVQENRKILSPEFRDYLIQLSDSGTTESLQSAMPMVRSFNTQLLANLPVVVGASGAVYGLLMGYGMMFPNRELYLYFFIPVKAKYLVFGLGSLALYMGLQNNPTDSVAHFAHLGGILFGFILMEYWKRKGI